MRDVSEKSIEIIVAAAREKVAAKDYGDDVVYQTELTSSAFEMNHVSMMNFMRLLGDQVEISGHRRLGSRAVDVLVNHANVERAFDYRRKGGSAPRRRQLLNRIYELRSIPTHSGIGLSGGGMVTSMLFNEALMRVSLLSELARDALLSFLQAPRSYLIGHPMFDTVECSMLCLRHCE